MKMILLHLLFYQNRSLKEKKEEQEKKKIHSINDILIQLENNLSDLEKDLELLNKDLKEEQETLNYKQ